jgi:uncharacterized protein YaiL (DUF2058 family)
MKSLQDQLLGAGLVDTKKAKSLKQEQRKQNKQKNKQAKGKVEVDETQQRLEEERRAKVDKDRELNRQRKAQADEKAIAAQIKQLIQSNRIKPESDELGYQFADGTKIQKIYVSPVLLNQLSKGQVSIARLDGSYHLVPNLVADKISQRDESYVVPLKVDQEELGDDDPYADYKIPDDLMW